MSYDFHYSYANDTWYLAYLPNNPPGLGYDQPEYELPGDLPEGDWALYADVYDTSDGACAGLLVEMQDGQRIGLLGTWAWPLGYTEEGGENYYVANGERDDIGLRIEYHSEAGELHLFASRSTGVWQPVAVVPVATPVDTGLLLKYADPHVNAHAYLAGVALLPTLEPPDGLSEGVLPPTAQAAPPVVQQALTLGSEPTVYALVGAPFGDLEFDVGKSVRWLEYFSDKMFVLDVNLGDPRYWIVNWAITFPDAEHAVTSINFFERPADFRKEQFRLADQKLAMEDDGWVLFVDGSEGLSFDNETLPDDYDFNPFMSFVYREIARAEAAVSTEVVVPHFVFLRSDEVQNVTYEHRANFDDGSVSLLQPISVPYYHPYMGMKRLVTVAALRNPAFDWASIDTYASPNLAGMKMQLISYAYAHWNLQDVQPGDIEPAPLSEANDDGFRMRKRISKVRPIAALKTDAWNPATDTPVGVPGPWAMYTTLNTNPDFDPITDSPVTEPDAQAQGIKTPLYDCVFRLNMRDGVWYEGDVSGNTPMMWDALNNRWQTAYNPNTWAELGVQSGQNPQYIDQPSPVPPTPE